MSSTLYWNPVIATDDTYVSDQLKFILRKRFGEPVKATITNADINYLTGLFDAGVKDAGELLKALEKHGSIELKEVY